MDQPEADRIAHYIGETVMKTLRENVLTLAEIPVGDSEGASIAIATVGIIMGQAEMGLNLGVFALDETERLFQIGERILDIHREARKLRQPKYGFRWRQDRS